MGKKKPTVKELKKKGTFLSYLYNERSLPVYQYMDTIYVIDTKNNVVNRLLTKPDLI